VVSVHLMSTLLGAAGTAELVDFAARIGMRPGWIQHPGTHREHFDLMGVGRIEAARLAGVEQVDRREFVARLHARRLAMGGGR